MSECDLTQDNDSDRISEDSLECVKIKPSIFTSQVANIQNATKRIPFLLHNQRSNFLSFLFPSTEEPTEEEFPPILDDTPEPSKKADSGIITFPASSDSNCQSWNVQIDDEVLIRKGLKRNVDGSFSKLPETEEALLPFVAREYKGMDFPKKKNTSSNKAPQVLETAQKKTFFTFSGKPGEGKSMMDIIQTRLERNVSEEVLVSRRSTRNGHCDGVDNLTDCMKEKLMKTCERVASLKLPRVLPAAEKNKVEKSKNVCPLKGHESSASKIGAVKKDMEALTIKLRRNGQVSNDPIIKERSKVFTKTNHLRDDSKESRKPEGSSCNYTTARKHKSDLLLPLTKAKTKLTYSERYQRENGYDPLYLRQCDKDTPTDTSRSNFGDSGLEKLSDVYSQTGDENEQTDTDEDEEEFYKKIIFQDKYKINQNEIHPFSHNASTSATDHQWHISEAKGPNQIPSSRRTKSTVSNVIAKRSIKMPSNESQGKKMFTHSSSETGHGSSSQAITKAELAIRARAYGHLANARNIWKLKFGVRSKMKADDSDDEDCHTFSSASFGQSSNVSGCQSPSLGSQASNKSSSKNLRFRLSQKSDQIILPKITNFQQVVKNPSARKRIVESVAFLPAVDLKQNALKRTISKHGN